MSLLYSCDEKNKRVGTFQTLLFFINTAKSTIHFQNFASLNPAFLSKNKGFLDIPICIHHRIHLLFPPEIKASNPYLFPKFPLFPAPAHPASLCLDNIPSLVTPSHSSSIRPCKTSGFPNNFILLYAHS